MKRGSECSESSQVDGSLTIVYLRHCLGVEMVEQDPELLVRILFDKRVQKDR